MNKMNRLIKVITNYRLLRMLLSMQSSGYLYEIGWINSFESKRPVDKNGKALPWVTYSFIDFIEDRLNKNLNIFEFGSGNSTLWYASKVNTVTSVEHDKNWFEEVKLTMPKNVNINYVPLEYNGAYSKFLNNYEKKFDIIIIDGRDRVNCIIQSISCLNETGVMVLDDSQRDRYIKGVDFLLSKKFKKIDFHGISPGLFYKKTTTIFYKHGNCLGI